MLSFYQVVVVATSFLDLQKMVRFWYALRGTGSPDRHRAPPRPRHTAALRLGVPSERRDPAVQLGERGARQSDLSGTACSSPRERRGPREGRCFHHFLRHFHPVFFRVHCEEVD